jgi:S1-C subfamily serine protease
VSVNGTTITSAESLTNALLGFKPGASVTVGWVDAQGTSHSASVQLTTGPPA